MTKSVFDIMVVEEYYDRSGAERVQYYRAGVAFANARGGFNCEVVPGMALTGRFVIFPKQDKSSSKDGEQR